MTRKSIIEAITSSITTVGINVIPAGGVFISGWATETAVLLYLIENMVSVLLVGLRVRLLAPAREGVPGAKPLERGALIRYCLMIGLSFSLASGLFIVFFVFLIPDVKREVEVGAIRLGLAGMLGFQLFSFIWDFFLLRPLSLSRSQVLIETSLGRVFLLYLAVFIGICVAFFNGPWFLGPFVILKTIVDIILQLQFLFGRGKRVFMAK